MINNVKNPKKSGESEESRKLILITIQIQKSTV